jgi:hypothetical protein
MQEAGSSEKLVLWHVEPLLGNDRETKKYTTTIAN